MGKVISAADLFCGAGGTSTGLYRACKSMGRTLDLIAINHWQIALKTHRENHPEARHIWADLSSLNPREVMKGKKLDLLVASPECIFHSNARGGKPIKEQLRASAWCVLRWVEALLPDNILIENVQEFRKWGPLGVNGRPLKSRKGETYDAYTNALRSLGYTVADRVLTAADYGDPTTRQRLFIIARHGNKKIVWPEPTHSESGDGLKQWRSAREIIDWSEKGKSIFNRKKPLAEATMRRITAGLKKFGGDAAEPFIMAIDNGSQKGSCARGIDQPLPTIIASKARLALVEPFLVKYHGDHKERDDSHQRVHSVDKPIATLDTSNRFGLVEPFIAIMKGQSKVRGIDKPLPTLTTNPHLYLCEPFIVQYYGKSGETGIDKPLNTITTRDRFGLVEPYQLDILFRMLQPHELAAAMSFPEKYKFASSKADTVKQIGNAVPVRTAEALCNSLLAA